jgi:F0F1-type ATP synthase membrane subunit c/vacuolar-type H+-ATPase subunit K
MSYVLCILPSTAEMNADWSGIGVAVGGGTSVGGIAVGSGVAAGAQATAARTNKSKAPITTRENVGFLCIAFSSFPLRNYVKLTL